MVAIMVIAQLEACAVISEPYLNEKVGRHTCVSVFRDKSWISRVK